MKRTPQAAKLAADLDNELAAAGMARGVELVWSPQERATIDLACRQLDRIVELQAAYDAADDEPKLRIKLSTEMRLLETSLGRLLRQIKTEVAGPESATTIKARRAVNTRWDRVRAAHS